MKRNFKTVLCALLVVSMLLSLGTGCAKKDEGNVQETDAKKQTTVEPQQELLEYSVYYNNAEAAKWANNPNDVVTPYIEKKFNIKVKEVILPTTQTFQERMSQWIAADDIPDVILDSKNNCDYAVSTDKFAILDDYIKDMTNFNSYMDERYWGMYLNDSKKYQIPCIQLNLSDPKYADDPYTGGFEPHALWLREDILKMCGYAFTPISKIAASTTELGKKPTAELFNIEPAISTPDDFYNLLKKVKALNLKVGDKTVQPLSIISWFQFHFGSMFDFGHWRIDENGNVAGFLGTPGAKDYYKYLVKLYREDLLDKDFIIQKDEQLQEKVATGRVFCGGYVPDINAAMQSMKEINPDATIRYIAWPKQTPDKGFFDTYVPGFERCIIKKDFKDIKRLTQYFDWFYSGEGLDLITWGPESAGLWEIKDGKKVFKDKVVENDVLNGIHDNKGADFYGLYDYTNTAASPYWSKAAMTTPSLYKGNPVSYERSYPPKPNIYVLNRNILGLNGVDFQGKASYGADTQNVSAVSSYYWSDFTGNKVAKLLNTKTDSEFETVWNEIYNEFMTKGKYEAAVADMKVWFMENKIK